MRAAVAIEGDMPGSFSDASMLQTSADSAKTEGFAKVFTT
jgi:hypothetical protein